jgi:hypothetical protein
MEGAMDTRVDRRIPVVAVALAAVIALISGAPSAVAQQTQNPVPISVSPALPAEGDTIVVAADLVVPLISVASTVEIDGQIIVLNIISALLSPQPPPELAHLVWTLPPQPAGIYTLEIVRDLPLVTLGLTIRPRATQLGLIGGRFQVTVADQQAGARTAAAALSDSGGYFTFFDPTNIELTVKIVDGRPVNGHFWIFVASMTDTPLSLTMTDTQGATCPTSCPARTYTNPPHTNQNFIDVGTF